MYVGLASICFKLIPSKYCSLGEMQCLKLEGRVIDDRGSWVDKQRSLSVKNEKDFSWKTYARRNRFWWSRRRDCSTSRIRFRFKLWSPRLNYKELSSFNHLTLIDKQRTWFFQWSPPTLLRFSWR